MKFNELQISAAKDAKRAGRGIAAGRGKTAGRGTKGQRSRTGSGRGHGFEGGQTPLMRRLPKSRGRGAHSYKPAVETVYTGQLETLGGKITTVELAAAGLISSAFVPTKLVLKGELTKKVAVEMQNASTGAIEAVEQAGGSFTKVARAARPQTSSRKIEQATAKAARPEKPNAYHKPEKAAKK
jgi:large subunit ribosomal protein L15